MVRSCEVNVRTYLHQYQTDEAKFFTWLKSNYIEPRDAVETIYGYMADKKQFHGTHEFCEAVLRDTRQREIDELLSPLDINLNMKRRKILWHLIINLLLRMVGIVRRLPKNS
jgi:hypothetical protein